MYEMIGKPKVTINGTIVNVEFTLKQIVQFIPIEIAIDEVCAMDNSTLPAPPPTNSLSPPRTYEEMLADVYAELMKAFSVNDLNKWPAGLSIEGHVNSADKCQHDWTEYVGLKESFSYCKKCDEKAVSDKKK
jgi:hypothetical protein